MIEDRDTRPIGRRAVDEGRRATGCTSVASSVMRANSFRVARPREVGFDNFELVAYRV